MRYLKRAAIEILHKNIGRDLPVTQGKINLGKVDLILEKINLKPYNSKEKYDTIYKKAACLLEGFCRGHAFPDGNKRTALLSAFAFLQANDHYLVIPLNVVEFLVNVSQNKAETEEEIDKLIEEISQWLEERTATNKKEFKKKNNKYVIMPLLGLFLLLFTGVGIFYVSRKIDQWFATKYHPEYKKNIAEMMKFIVSTLDDSKKALENIK